MTGPELPDAVHRLSALFIVALGTGMIAVHTLLAAMAAQSPGSTRRPATMTAAVGAYLALWFGLAMTVGDGANFPLAHESARPLVTLLVGFGPMLVAVAALFASKTLRQLNAGMPSQWLIWAQTYRAAGVMFLFPFMYYGLVPAGFAIPAAVGDVVTGALAPLVGLAVARQRPNAIKWAIAWNLFGVLDLIVAPVSAVLSGAQVLGLYPLSLVPLFLGPPLGILTHVYSLRNLATHSSPIVAGTSQRSIDDDRGTEISGRSWQLLRFISAALRMH